LDPPRPSHASVAPHGSRAASSAPSFCSMSAFSKVNLDDFPDDDEEERQNISECACARFKAAQDAYTTKGSNEATLRLFEQAESTMKPLMDNGFMGLQAKEVEAVLKGRLHQAVILAHLEHIPDRWTKIKAFAEDVLQFDFSNCHARWLRALALQNGGLATKRGEAELEMSRAIEAARSTGKHVEADNWEAEMRRCVAEAGGSAAAPTDLPEGEAGTEPELEGEDEFVPDDDGDKKAAKAPAEPAPAAEQQQERPSSSASAAASAKPSRAKGDDATSSLQKGFFNKKPPRAAAAPAAKAKEDPLPSAPQAGSAAAAAGGASAAQARAEVEEQRRQLEEQRGHMESLRQLLQEERTRSQEQQDEAQKESAELHSRLEAIGAEFEQALSAEVEAGSLQQTSANWTESQQHQYLDASKEVVALKGSLRRAHTAASEVKAAQQSARDWGESQHQRYVDLATEVLTLKEMSARENRERQDASKAQIADMRDLAKRIGDLKSATKTLREHVRLKTAGAARDEKEEPDPQRLAECAADFRALPLSSKLAAFADDAAVLRLAAVAFMLGMLLLLGVFVEGFGRSECRFVCSR